VNLFVLVIVYASAAERPKHI